MKHTVLFTILSLMAAPSIFAITPSEKPYTTIHLLRLFPEGELDKKYHANPPVRATCSDSLVSLREDARRCVTKKRTYDPCFKFDDHPLACLSSPWSRSVTLIKRSKLQPKLIIDSSKDALKKLSEEDYKKLLKEKFNLKRTHPWGLILEDGTTCTLLTGTTREIEGMRVNYRCDNSLFLLGKIIRSKKGWRIHKQTGENRIIKVKIRSAWY